MTVDTSEKSFEASIEGALLASGPDDPTGGDEPGAYGRIGDYRQRRPDEYDKARCLIPRDVVDFLIATQPATWARLTTQHGEARVRERFLKRLAGEVETRGALDVLLKPISDLGTGRPSEGQLAPLSEILKYINEHFGTEFTDQDRVQFFADDMQRRLMQQEDLRVSFSPQAGNSPEHHRLVFHSYFTNVLNDMMSANTTLYAKLVDDPSFYTMFREYMLDSFTRAVQSPIP